MVSLASFGFMLKANDCPPSKSDSDIVCEALMLELECQIKDVERINRELDKERKRRANVADYSWLISTPPKSFEIPQLERLALEDLASKVRPEDSGNIISEFRKVIEGLPRELHEIPHVMRCIIEKHLIERPSRSEDTSLRWLTKSMSQLRTLKHHASSKVYPVSNIELQDLPGPRRVRSMSDFPSAKDMLV